MENILALEVSCRGINNRCRLKGCVGITILLQLCTTGFEQKWSNLTLREIQVAIGGINVDISLKKNTRGDHRSKLYSIVNGGDWFFKHHST